ncbi:biotin carboxylase N-terminal domain-containing protein [Geodermatophilus sabuli]|uniref:Acetyl/propionyl-CoA carboxylase, alpha subunit n=1 Tax=Geodermatophilus sabuli TaxID=1564158 RepID=A0A285EKJ0_9ACTN|nr:biotin carboxylase N-terminal domain-containing protein [Geodermatophilus sabuli]MBB3083870.1 acetyl/propionyl-CoA carboxylase alpha subunit/acetyl-CoA carboxylase carboxyltransferase component [Geodermatophilus sabuli]SNX98521.1 Acetyl/propionyl-CoA carboxylase, alpha subunit [Geodermatophilus sabuli]
MFSRIAVVNRGEPAMRLIRAVRELDAEHGTHTRVIALHTEAERRATFVRAADEAVLLRETGAGNPYLDHDELARALRTSGADAAWVGWGFVAEDPAFAELCGSLGVTFIGPTPESMRLLGAKIEAKVLAEEAGVPVAPWSRGPVETLDDGRRHAATIGYPLIVKARSGGGGRGIRVVRSEAELEEALTRTQAEAQRTFGDPVVFMERLVEGGRHVEVQVIADQHGAVWAPGVRDCSVQRRNQKVLEESRSPALSQEQDAALRGSAIALVKAAGYVGAGTVEFLYQPDERLFTFLEVNTRLQVEHPVTEEVTGLDIVKLQLHVAAGGRLEGDPPAESGHAIEARLNAEDAEAGFAPAPGRVELMRLPTGPGVRVDTGMSVGDVIPPAYDSMVAKVIAWGRDRPEALARLRCALRETTVVLRGGTTTKSFLLDLLDRPEVVAGTADTGWLDRADTAVAIPEVTSAWVALVQVAIDVADAEESGERAAFLASARGGRPRAPHGVGRPMDLGHRGQVYRLTVARTGPDRYRVGLDGRSVDVELDRLSALESRLAVGDRRYAIVAVTAPGSHLVEVDGVAHRVGRDAGGTVRAPAPAVVVDVRAQPGQEVEAGQTIVVLESMKMETAVRAPFAGRVREVLATVNVQVDAGAALLSLDRAGGEAAEATGERVELPDGAVAGSTADARDRATALLSGMQALITGYDVAAHHARQLIADYGRVRGELPVDDPDLVQRELAVLTTVADLAELSRNRPASEEEEEADQQVHSPREYFHAYLHSLDVEREGLPDSFRDRLARALRHYGVEELEPGPALQEAVYRVFLSQQRVADQLPAVLALLDRWLTAAELPADPVRSKVGEVLDRLVVATQLRYPSVGDLARAVRYRHFEEPVVLQARQEVLEEARRLLAALDEAAERGDPSAGVDRMEALVASPEPLITLLAQRFERETTVPDPVLEVLTRRYYRSRALQDLRTTLLDGRSCVTADYELAGSRLHLVALMVEAGGLPAALASLAPVLAGVADPAGLVLDLYLSWPDRPADGDEVAERLREQLAGVAALRAGRRVTVSVCTPDGDVEPITFRPTPDRDGLAEERIVRGLHPLTAQRLNLWRLKHFDGERAPSAEDTYLFHITGKENPNDERFIAMAEVRDLTPVRDDAGEVVGFPTIERQLASCLDSLRRAQSLRRSRRPLQHNRVYLYAWPSIEVPLSQVAAFAGTAAPLTIGAGLDQIVLLARLQEEQGRPPRDVALRFSARPGTGVRMEVTDRPTEPMRPLDEYTEKVLSSRARGAPYPYELAPYLAGPDGSFVEHDLDDRGRLVPVQRPPGRNKAGLVVGVVSTPTPRYPEGMTRVALFGDPTKQLGTVSEPECARVVAALDLAEERGLPLEWFALSSGARISMDSGTENMDWVSRALRRIIEFTQAGGEINVVVTGINVGAQPYWNAEATMLMHTKGILVMTPDSAMVLTGKHSLDYSGGVSAEDNFGIGGYDRVMGPNGQAQYWAPNLTAACQLLTQHYEHTYRAPGERWPRSARTSDPRGRDVRDFPHTHPDSDFTRVGDIFSAETNPDRKKAFDIRTVMRAVADADHPTLERWAGMADADTSVVYDAHLGGYPVTLLGIESRPIMRRGSHPADGPDQWTAGTLFPRSSKKTARAINATSGNRPLVVLANLSGFDGSPESLRNIQLEYGAEIGRAITNFDGPIVFCVVSRYHGGAFVVFSGVLNDNMEVLAVEGSYASVLGGAPAAAVVFTRDVDQRTAKDPRVRELEADIAAADGVEAAHLRVELATVRTAVRSEKLGEVAAEFEAIHNIERAQQMGSVHAIIPAAELRPRLIDAVERGMARAGSPPSP